MAEADELMEYYGDQSINAAARLRLAAYQNRDYGKAHFYGRVGRYLERFIDVDAQVKANVDARRQERYEADSAQAEMLHRVINNRTLH
ncbi:MAG TPA: hypothetical protein PL193_10475 [Xanthobacteraceae bacterium]|nr:hypothetical protein [Xanthobacteraceae bacterium]